MSLVQIINYDNSANFQFDINKIEFVNSKAQLKDLRPVGSTFFATFDSDLDGVWGDGDITTKSIANVTVSGGKADFSGGGVKEVVYYGQSKINPSTGAIRFKYIPDYNLIPVGICPMFNYRVSSSDSKNRLQLSHYNSQQLVLEFWDKDGVPSGLQFISFKTLNQGQEYIFELNWDFTGAGDVKLFIDGVQEGSTITLASTRLDDLTTIQEIVIGGNGADYFLNELASSSIVQHTVDYTPLAISATIYSIDNPSVINNSGFVADLIDQFEIVYANSVKVIVDGYYYTGSAWATSDGTYAQSSTPAQVVANITTLDISDGAIIKYTVFLGSDGSTQTTITSITSYYDFSFIPDEVAQCIVYGTIADLSVESVENATITFYSNKTLIHTNNFLAKRVIKSSDSQGRFDVSLAETATIGKTINCEIELTDANNKTVKTKYKDITIPNQVTARLEDII